MEAEASDGLLVVLAATACFVVIPFLLKPKKKGAASESGVDAGFGDGDSACDAGDGGGGDGGGD
ncbi:hypothetical protein [Rhizobium sp. BK251]|uniref:hypothetical protein n=1 Tax=Rhizobium sp. BK251 TaxID=2512125 RepID=UPI00104BA7BF|nr:hypothetical protein [Rhizobium sp. BK251]